MLLLDTGFKGTLPDKLKFVIENVFGSNLTVEERQRHMEVIDIKLVGVYKVPIPAITNRQLLDFSKVPMEDITKSFPRVSAVLIKNGKGLLWTANGVIASVLQSMPRYYGQSEFQLINTADGQFKIEVRRDKIIDTTSLNHLEAVNASIVDPVAAILFQKTVVDYFVNSREKFSRAVFSSGRKAGLDDPAVVIPIRRGGIDLTTANMHVETQTDSRLPGNDRRGVKFDLDPAMLRRLQDASGFSPVIIAIKPMINLAVFLGLNKKATPLHLPEV